MRLTRWSLLGLGCTVLACATAPPPSVSKLIDRGDDAAALAAVRGSALPPADDPGWANALASAAHSGDAELLSALLDGGALPNARVGAKRLSPLHFALHPSTSTVHLEAERVLLERGAEPKDVDTDLRSPLHYLASRPAAYTQERKQAAVQLLLEHGADATAPDAGGETPLHYAAAAGDSTALLQLLIDRQADVSVADANGLTPLDAAAAADHPSLAPFFFERGATPHVILTAPSWPKNSMEVHREFEISGRSFASFGDWKRDQGDTRAAREAWASSESQLRLAVAELQRAVSANRSAANLEGWSSKDVAADVATVALGRVIAPLVGVPEPGADQKENRKKLNGRAEELEIERAKTQKLLDEVVAKRAALPP